MKEGGTLVPRSLFLNRTETIATQAINYASCVLLNLSRGPYFKLIIPVEYLVN